MSGDTVKLDRGYFLAFAVEGILWGGHLALFCLALSVLFGYQRRMPINKFLLTAMIILFAFCTTHFSLVFTNVYTGLMIKKYSIGTEDNYLLGADFLIFITDCLSQIVLIYRCWLVWQKNYIIVLLPLLMSLSSLACGLSAGGLLEGIDPNATVAPPIVYRFGSAALGLPLGTNILLMSLIIGRIWYIARRSRNVLPSKSMQAAITMLVESGALIVVAQVTTCILFVLNEPSQNIAACATVQCYGIAPILLIIRFGMGNAVDTGKAMITTRNTTHAGRSVIHILRTKDVELASVGDTTVGTNTTRTAKTDF